MKLYILLQDVCPLSSEVFFVCCSIIVGSLSMCDCLFCDRGLVVLYAGGSDMCMVYCGLHGSSTCMSVLL